MEAETHISLMQGGFSISNLVEVLLNISNSKQATNWMTRNKPNTKTLCRAVRKEELWQRLGIVATFWTMSDLASLQAFKLFLCICVCVRVNANRIHPETPSDTDCI